MFSSQNNEAEGKIVLTVKNTKEIPRKLSFSFSANNKKEQIWEKEEPGQSAIEAQTKLVFFCSERKWEEPSTDQHWTWWMVLVKTAEDALKIGFREASIVQVLMFFIRLPKADNQQWLGSASSEQSCATWCQNELKFPGAFQAEISWEYLLVHKQGKLRAKTCRQDMRH